MVDLIIVTTIKHAQCRILTCPLGLPKIRLHRFDFWIVRRMVVIIEVAAIRAHPQLRPTKPLLPRGDIFVRRTRHYHVVRVALAENSRVDGHLIDMEAAAMARLTLLARDRDERNDQYMQDVMSLRSRNGCYCQTHPGPNMK